MPFSHPVATATRTRTNAESDITKGAIALMRLIFWGARDLQNSICGRSNLQETRFPKFNLRRCERWDVPLSQLVGNRSSRHQRLRIQGDIAPHRSHRTYWRGGIAVDSDRQTAGISGSHRQSRLIRDRIALTSLQQMRDEHGAVDIAYLYPAIRGCADDNARRVARWATQALRRRCWRKRRSFGQIFRHGRGVLGSGEGWSRSEQPGRGFRGSWRCDGSKRRTC